MSSNSNQLFARFISKKLGLPYTQASILRHLEDHSYEQAWLKFVTSNKLFREAAEFNRIYEVEDIWDYYRRVDYANMRSTFPSKSHGRNVLGPCIMSIQQIAEQKRIDEERQTQFHLKLSEIRKIPQSIIGKTIIHMKDDGLSFGRGKVIDIIDSKGCIVVQFAEFGKKVIDYHLCMEKNYIEFI